MPGENGWSEWSRHVLSELERFNTVAERLEERQSELRTAQETARIEVKNCQSLCMDGLKRVEEQQQAYDGHSRKKDLERTRQDREDVRSRRRLTIMVVICVISGLFAVASAVIAAIAIVMKSEFPLG